MELTSTSMATIVSMYPADIMEFKPGLVPNNFRIKGARVDDFEILVVGDARFPVYLDGDRGSIWVTTPALVLAQSIVSDFIKAQHGFEVDSCHPGMFFVPGERTKLEIKQKFEPMLVEAKEKQVNWFKRLIFLADDDWAKYHRHLTITDTQRFAAKYLKITREWSIEVNPTDFKPCPACANQILSAAIRCQHCSTVLDRKRFEELKLVIA